jgi:hypothetical protein
MSDDDPNWWGKNAVLAAALTGLLGLVGTVAVAIITTSGSGSDGGSNGSSHTRTSSAAPNPPSTGTTAVSGDGAAVAWSRDRIRLPYGQGLDLDAATPTLTTDGEFLVSIGDTAAFPVILLPQPAGSLGSQPASYSACAEAITTNSISGGYPSHPGDTFCEQSASGAHLAAVTVTSWDPHGGSGYGVSEVAVIVWQVA